MSLQDVGDHDSLHFFFISQLSYILGNCSRVAFSLLLHGLKLSFPYFRHVANQGKRAMSTLLFNLQLKAGRRDCIMFSLSKCEHNIFAWNLNHSMQIPFSVLISITVPNIHFIYLEIKLPECIFFIESCSIENVYPAKKFYIYRLATV